MKKYNRSLTASQFFGKSILWKFYGIKKAYFYCMGIISVKKTVFFKENRNISLSFLHTLVKIVNPLG